jgi:hypothetical protein
MRRAAAALLVPLVQKLPNSPVRRGGNKNPNSTVRMYVELFFIVFIIACLYFVYVQEAVREGFATHAIDAEHMPRCFLRDTAAQNLAQRLAPFVDREEYKELLHILQKILCIEADVSGAGIGGFETARLEFATAHDIEPVGNFVGRCLRGAVRQRDIDIAFDKYRVRGAELITELCGEADAAKDIAIFQQIVQRVAGAVSAACARKTASLDIPAGPRDPGYYEPDAVEFLSKY